MAPKGGGPEGWEVQNFALFFSSPTTSFAFFLSLTVCLLVVFWWCLKRWDPEMCTFGVHGLSCEAPAALGPKQKLAKVGRIARELMLEPSIEIRRWT